MEKTPAALRENTLRNIEHTMKAEGFTLSAHTRRQCLRVLAGEAKAEQMVQRQIQRYAPKTHG